jgi:hypothetical protein
VRLIAPDRTVPRLAAVERDATLHELLDAAQRFAPEYAPLMASHLPMALAALHGLGATPGQMRRYFGVESANLKPLEPDTAPGIAAVDGDWTALRGRIEAFPALRAHFAAALARDGRDACLRAALPLLLPGFGGVAFHGAIRTAHAIESGHDGELATALGYWAARWTVLPAPAETDASFATPADWLDALDARLLAHEPAWRGEGRLISNKMPQAAATRAYSELAGAFAGFDGDVEHVLGELALAAAQRYAATRNFTVLHMATASRALRVLLPWLPADAVVPASAWHAVAAASLASGVALQSRDAIAAEVARRVLRGDAEPLSPGGADWATVRELACECDDDHAIKLVHAMAEQQRLRPSPVWLAAAARAVQARS